MNPDGCHRPSVLLSGGHWFSPVAVMFSPRCWSTREPQARPALCLRHRYSANSEMMPAATARPATTTARIGGRPRRCRADRRAPERPALAARRRRRRDTRFVEVRGACGFSSPSMYPCCRSWSRRSRSARARRYDSTSVRSSRIARSPARGVSGKCCRAKRRSCSLAERSPVRASSRSLALPFLRLVISHDDPTKKCTGWTKSQGGSCTPGAMSALSPKASTYRGCPGC